jgi:MoaA/NifB/PqqE/SkfB family radical SAM enzyme
MGRCRFSKPDWPLATAMTSSTQNYFLNLARLLRGDRLLRPLVATYYATTQCNLNCAYCEYFGARRNAQAEEQLGLEDALHVLRVIRTGVDSLIITGGEPLLYPDIDDLVSRARRELKFRQLTLLTNGRLLPQHEMLLASLDRLVISLDSVDADQWSRLINVSPAVADSLLDHIRTYAAQQRKYRYRLIVNCVLTPQTLSGAPEVLEFCVRHHILISFSPQAVNNWPHYDLLVSPAYRDFIRQLIERKQHGAPILGSVDYLHTLLDFAPYACYPLLVPRIMPNGDLVYPCRPIERGQVAQGGRPCNLLDVQSWDEALQLALRAYDSPPETCASCFQQCFAEPSLLQTNPLSLLRELLYAPSRRGSVWTHAPG